MIDRITKTEDGVNYSLVEEVGLLSKEQLVNFVGRVEDLLAMANEMIVRDVKAALVRDVERTAGEAEG